MKDLVIIDYSTSGVHFYKVDCGTEIYEDYIRFLGHNPDECAWMFGDNIEVYEHKGILKN